MMNRTGPRQPSATGRRPVGRVGPARHWDRLRPGAMACPIGRTGVDVGAWLRGLGLGQYEPAFRDNEIDAEVLPRLTADDLKDMGVTVVGHRRKLLDAIDCPARRRRGPAVPGPRRPTSLPPGPAVAAQAERRQLTVMFVDLVGSTPALDPARSRGDARGPARLSGHRRRRRRSAEGHRGQVHGRRRAGLFRFAAGARGRRRAGGMGRARRRRARARLRTPAGAPLTARVGIATGLVVVGDLSARVPRGRRRWSARPRTSPPASRRSPTGRGRDRAFHPPPGRAAL